MRTWVPVSLGVVLAACQSVAPELAALPEVPVAVTIAVGGVT